MVLWILVNCLFAQARGAALLPEIPQNNRIVGGFPIDIADYPYQVSLLMELHFCGGTLISPTVVISAAHCTADKAVTAISVRVGSSNKSQGGTVIPVRAILEHPRFNEVTLDYDVAILVLSVPQNYTTEFPKLPDASLKVVEDELALVSGWGSKAEDDEGSEELQAVFVPIVDHDDCKAYLENSITNRMICAGDVRNGGIDSCQGDSGGPMMMEDILVGIVSWGLGCARPNLPGVYTNVAAVSRWILEHMNDFS